MMRLELAEFPVKQIRLGHRFKYENQILEVDEAALIALVSEDARITDVKLAIATPGEKTRITGIRDIVEPRYKVSGGGQVFSGVLGEVATVGEGRTHRLSGMTVVAAAEYDGTIRAGTTVQRSAILDMSGRGAAISRFSAYAHLVVSFRIRCRSRRARCAWRDSVRRAQGCPASCANHCGIAAREDIDL